VTDETSPFGGSDVAGQRRSDRIAPAQAAELTQLLRAGTTPQRLALRISIVLLGADGQSTAAIADRLSICVDTAAKWRRRWRAAPSLPALEDAKRSGRPPQFTPVQVAQVKALACRPAAECGLPLSRWSAPELARQVIADRTCTRISASTIRRWLSQEALKPWQYQSWIFITDPNFATKAQRVLDLYDRHWDGRPLAADEYVISADEKTSIQARCRCHPSLAPGRARMMRVNHDYHRRGAVAYLAASDVHRANVFGRCEPTTGITPFEALVAQVMTQEPYRSAKRVFWVVDNGSSHRGGKAVDRLAKQFPNAVMVHTGWIGQAVSLADPS
jgi:transposase